MSIDIAIPTCLPVDALNAGLFVARGRGGRHGVRVTDSHELIFVQQGRLGMFEEGVEFAVEAGQTLILQAGRRHGGTEDYPDNLRFYWVHFRLRAGDGVDSLPVPQFATLADPDRMTALFRRFLDDQETRTRLDASSDLTVLQMLYEVAQPGNRSSATTGGVLPAQRADEYIRVHAFESIGTSEVAAALGYHPDYLGRVYKQHFGVSITDALNRRRIHEAKARLMDAPSTIDQIARECGYSDAEYFRRVFRKHEDMSPGAFRRLYARVHVNSE